tara:strand:- start:714 stop:2051 length:1338 start_codon:yes stop_codon:yes gene_type:complete
MNLLKDEVSLLLRKLALPASIGTLFQTLFTIVDTFYAGKISPEALSALSKSFPIYFMIIATSIGVTVAGTSLIGSSIGEKNEKNVLTYFANVIIYAIIISLVVSILGFALGEKIFLLMNSSQEVTILGLEYINIIFLGTVLFILVVALNSFLHAEGDTVTYRNVLIFSFFLNIILNPIFIFGFLFIPPLGITGIGVSTLIAQFVSLLIILIKILKNQRLKQMTLNHFKAKYFFLKNIFFQSMPITIAIFGYSIAATIVFTYVGIFGEYAVAGYGSATRIEQVLLLPVLGINTAIISIIAQNIGAKYYNRVEQSYYTSIKYGFFIMLIAAVVIFVSADIVPKFFSSNNEVVMHGSIYLKISAFILPSYPIFFLSNGFFMALKKSEKAMFNNIIRNVVVPIMSFYIAKSINADFKTFFYIWGLFQWLISLALIIYVRYYIKYKLVNV